MTKNNRISEEEDSSTFEHESSKTTTGDSPSEGPITPGTGRFKPATGPHLFSNTLNIQSSSSWLLISKRNRSVVALFALFSALLTTELRLFERGSFADSRQQIGNQYDIATYTNFIFSEFITKSYSFALFSTLSLCMLYVEIWYGSVFGKVYRHGLSPHSKLNDRAQLFACATCQCILQLSFTLSIALHIAVKFATSKDDLLHVMFIVCCLVPFIISNNNSTIFIISSAACWIYCLFLMRFMKRIMFNLATHISENENQLNMWIAMFGGIRSYSDRDIVYHLFESLPVYIILIRRFKISLQKEKMNSTENELQVQTNVLRAIFAAIPAVVMFVDTHLNVKFSRGSASEIYGIPQGFYEGVTLEQACAYAQDTEWETTKDLHNRALFYGECSSYTASYATFPGSVLKHYVTPVRDANDRIIGVVTLSLDIREELASQQALLNSEENYRSLLESINDVVVKIDQTYKIQFINRDFLENSKESYIGHSFLDIFKDESVLKLASTQLHNLFTTKECLWEWKKSDHKQLEKEEEEVFFLTRGAPIVKDDKVVAATLLISDTTARRNAREQQKRVDEAKIASRSKSEFISQMSHEIRNPLNAIVGSLQLLSMNSENLSAAQHEYLSDASENTKLLLTVVSDILDMSKIESGRLDLSFEPVSILDIVESTASMLGSQAYKKGLDLYSFADPQIPACLLCDRNRITQIIMNFASNSIKFTKTGSITLAASLVNQTTTEATIRIECIDTGIGIKEADQVNIFQPFIQIKSPEHPQYTYTQEYKGWGLGLQICQRLAQAMKGSLGVSSVFGEGSTFYFEVTLRKVEDDESRTNGTGSIADYLPSIPHTDIIVINMKEKLYQILYKYLSCVHGVGKVENLKTIDDNFLLESNMIRNKMGHTNLTAIVGVDMGSCQHVINKLPSNCRVILIGHNLPNSEDEYMFVRLPMKLKKLVYALTDHALHSFTSVWPSSDVQELKTSPQKLKVLYVEDNALNRKVLRYLLNKIGITDIDMATNGVEGLEAVKRSEHPYDIIWMDLNMPIMNGQICAAKIRELSLEKASTPIVALTANADQDFLGTLRSNFDDIMLKPITIDKVVDIINKHVRCT